uniref:Mitochondrial carrier protein n=1 Tax=Elaeophora elaphi TaxID=1147741 RepID=A0A0R3S2E8_9BILA
MATLSIWVALAGLMDSNEHGMNSSLAMRDIGSKYVLSCCASFVAESDNLLFSVVTYPLDVVKTRLQVVPNHMKATGSDVKRPTMLRITWHICKIVKDEGFRSLFSGLSSAVCRHFIYTGFRMGVYEVMRSAIFDKEKEKIFPLWQSAICGLVSGAVAQFLASPTDLIKVQMQAKRLRKLNGFQSRFPNSYHVFVALYKRNGFTGLWTGWLPNTQRAALLNMSGEYFACYNFESENLATYDHTKHWLIAKGYLDNHYTHFIASLVSGMAAAVVSTPADVVKTRIMIQLRSSGEKKSTHQYKGSYDCLKQICRDEGFFALYKGFVPSYVRSAPWSLVFWLTYEQLRHMFGISGF